VSLSQTAIDFAPSADAVASKVCSTYGNQRSLPGLEVRDWLEAERQLLAEQNRSGVAGFQNLTGMGSSILLRQRASERLERLK
jgi:hypothetical protein